MKFAIRDNDVSFFTSPEELNKLYNTIWNKIPISMAVVPFISGKATYLSKMGYEDKEHPIGENTQLTNFLREKISQDKVDILLHGYNHQFVDGTYDFETDCNMKHRISAGKNYLEKLLGVKISVFAPPDCRISKDGLRAIEYHKLNLLGQYSFSPFRGQRLLSILNLPYYIRKKIFYRKHERLVLQYPFIFTFFGHKELETFVIVKSTKYDTLRAAIDICNSINGIFCLSVHYWELNADSSMRNTFYKTIEYTLSLDGVKFEKVSNLFI